MMMTVGVSDESKFLIIEDENYLLRLWDTAGQERYNCLPKNFYQNADGIFLLFDVCERKTFEGIAGWMKNISDKMKIIFNKSGYIKTFPVDIPVVGIQPELDIREEKDIVRNFSSSEMFSKLYAEEDAV